MAHPEIHILAKTKVAFPTADDPNFGVHGYLGFNRISSHGDDYFVNLLDNICKGLIDYVVIGPVRGNERGYTLSAKFIFNDSRDILGTELLAWRTVGAEGTNVQLTIQAFQEFLRPYGFEITEVRKVQLRAG